MMDKQMFNKAFSLLEMLVVLFVMSLLVFSISNVDKLKIIKIKKRIEQLQIQAISKKEKIFVSIKEGTLQTQHQTFLLGIQCEPRSFYINEYGNVSNGFTLYCGKNRLVVQIGNGVIDVY